ncbi:MAG: SpoIIE family protein phosphatase [Bacteroidia bacterium]|nr:SpoIIE family protein phosphatase [Bacteroidia bacterium]
MTEIYGQSSKETGIPSIRNYSPKEYKSGAQNWAIVQDKRSIMYFGNNECVLEYDGVTWRKIIVGNNSPVRSLSVDKHGKIYVGGVNELGYLIPDSTGKLYYFSLLNKYNNKYELLGDIWDSYCTDEEVYFRTDYNILFWNGKSFREWKSKNRIQYSFYINGKLFLRQVGIGLCELVKDSINIVKEGDIFAKKSIYGITEYNKNQLMITTKKDGFFIIFLSSENKVSSIVPLPSDIYDYVSGKDLYNSIRINDDLFTIGSWGGGIAIINRFGKTINILNKDKGLQDGIIQAQYIDNQGNLWLACSNGISKIVINSPVSCYNEFMGLEGGTIESICRYKGDLYVATHLGFFILSKDILVKEDTGSFLNTYSFKHFEQISDECWDLLEFKKNDYNTLIIASNTAISYLDENNKIVKIINCAPWDLYQSKIDSSRIFIGTANGLLSIYFSNGKWNKEQQIEEINENILRVAEDKTGNIWLTTNNQGIIKVRYFSDSVNAGKYEVNKYDTSKGLPDMGPFVPLEDFDKIMFGTSKGIYTINNITNKFQSIGSFGKKFSDASLYIHRMFIDFNNNIWIVAYNKENKIEVGYIDFTDKPEWIYIPFKDISYSNIEIQSLFNEKDGTTWIGGSNGLYRYDAGINKNYNIPFTTQIRKIIIGNDSVIFNGSYFGDNGEIILKQPKFFEPALKYSLNSVVFEFAAQAYENESEVYYSYILDGYDKSWSDWSKSVKKEYTNLPEGSYQFRVKAKNIYEHESSEAINKFIILPPWYRTIWAYIGYVILFVLILYISIRLNTRRLQALNKRLEKIIKDRTAEIRKQKEEIEFIHSELTASIKYAKRIQTAVLPGLEYVSQILAEYFILFKPRDIVSGDFYWLTTVKKWTIFCVSDCTGHGVPGAFMSMLGISFLNEIVRNEEVTQANHALNKLRKHVILALQQKGVSGEQKDGMDIALCAYDTLNNELQFAGANNQLCLIRSIHSIDTHVRVLRNELRNELIEIKGDKMPIAIYEKMDDFKNHIIDIKNGDTIYMFTDGYADQFGGPKGKKFMNKQLKNILIENNGKFMVEIKGILDNTIEKWKSFINTDSEKNHEQTDDICIMGVRF